MRTRRHQLTANRNPQIKDATAKSGLVQFHLQQHGPVAMLTVIYAVVNNNPHAQHVQIRAEDSRGHL